MSFHSVSSYETQKLTRQEGAICHPSRKQSRPPQTHFFVALHLGSITANYHVTTSLIDRYIPVAAARVGRRGCASPSKRRLKP